MSNVIVKNNKYTVDPLYQWDLNQDLVIYGLSLPSIPEIHFTNDAMDRAIVRQSTMDDAGVITVRIPNSLLQKPYLIKAYVCRYVGETFESLYCIEIPVKKRSMPKDYTITDSDEEIYSFNRLENMLENALERMRNEYEELYDQAIANATKEIGEKESESISKIDKVVADYMVEIGQEKVTEIENMSGTTVITEDGDTTIVTETGINGTKSITTITGNNIVNELYVNDALVRKKSIVVSEDEKTFTKTVEEV